MRRSTTSPLRKQTALALASLAVALAIWSQPAAARSIYVSNSAAGTVSVVSDASNQITGNPITVGPLPQGIAILPDGSKVYVANSGATSVSVINTANNSPSPIGSGATLSSPYGVAAAPDGSKVYVTNSAGGPSPASTIAVINTSTDTASTLALSGGTLSGPRGIAVSPDGARLYVADSGNNRVVVVNASTGAVIGTVATGVVPDGIALTPDESKVLAANFVDGTVSALSFNPISSVPIAVGAGARGVAIAPDGTKAYVTGFNAANVTTVNVATNAPSAPFGVGTNPYWPAVNPAGTRLYVPNSSLTANSLSVIDTATGASVVPAITGFNAPSAAAVVPDQAPTASFTTEPVGACADTKLNGSASTDSDGTVASYGWDFGDGKTETTTTSAVNHAYAKGGTYTAKLTVTDNEGTSTEKVFTGQTMSRNGSSAASKSQTVTIADAEKPSVVVKKPQKRKRYKRRTFRRIDGTVSDPCGTDEVNYALALSRGGKCRYLGNTGKLGRKRRSCNKPIFRKARLSGDKWSKTLGHRLPAGSYALSVNATDKAEVKSKTKKVRFRLR